MGPLGNAYPRHGFVLLQIQQLRGLLPKSWPNELKTSSVIGCCWTPRDCCLWHSVSKKYGNMGENGSL